MQPIRFAKDQLTDKALAALKEAAEQRLSGEVVARSQALRFALAFLANRQDRTAYDEFWRAVTEPVVGEEGICGSFGRRQTINSLCRYIRRMHGREAG